MTAGLLFASAAQAQRGGEEAKWAGPGVRPGSVEWIDTPTADVVDHQAYQLKFRLDAEGGIVSRLNFGVLRLINLGLSFDTDRIIGAGAPAVRPPAVYFKLRFYAGSRALPMFALGYDGQGYGRFLTDIRKHADREKGFFLVATKELIAPAWEWSLGGWWVPQDSIGGAFLGTAYTVENQVQLMTEWDNLRGPISDSRWNVGLRFFVSDDVTLEAAVRKIFWGSEHERIVRIEYRGIF